MSANQRYIVRAQITVRDQTGVSNQNLVFIFEVPKTWTNRKLLDQMIRLGLEQRFEDSLPLEDGKSEKFELKSYELEKVDWVLTMVSQRIT